MQTIKKLFYIITFFLFLTSCKTNSSKKIIEQQSKSKVQKNEQTEFELKRKLAGQMIVCGFNGTTLNSDFKQFLTEYKIGNVILFSKNIKTVKQTKLLCLEINETVKKATGHNAFICIDQEGGKINRLPKDLVSLCEANYFATNANPKLVYEAGYITAKQLCLCGITVNFAPVADINSNPKNPIIGSRAYGNTAEQVILYSNQMVKGLSAGGILSCAKHFPGHGDTDTDSHLNLPVVKKTYEQLINFELKPFASLIQTGIPMIMTAHILFPNIDKDFPATMSYKFLTEILRNELNFNGIIVTDDLEMNAIRKNFGIVQGAVTAINAGADMVCISVYSDGAKNISDALVSNISTERLKTSANRIYKEKDKIILYKNIEQLSDAKIKNFTETYNQKMQELNKKVMF